MALVLRCSKNSILYKTSESQPVENVPVGFVLVISNRSNDRGDSTQILGPCCVQNRLLSQIDIRPGAQPSVKRTIGIDKKANWVLQTQSAQLVRH
jgi:hypothetical protein